MKYGCIDLQHSHIMTLLLKYYDFSFFYHSFLIVLLFLVKLKFKSHNIMIFHAKIRLYCIFYFCKL